MIIFRKSSDLQRHLAGRTEAIAFIPTMGALHAGHTSLIGRARKAGHFTVCSIFVNPTQFNDREDYEKYPRSTEADIALLLDSGCDVLFLPEEADVYPNGPDAVTAYDFGHLETLLEGAHRPGHFRGVGQVVGRLLELVRPQHLYMGQKDYQQCLIVRSLLDQMTLDSKPELHISPTVREDDGLAMSSRNRRLTDPQRSLAPVIYQCLVSIQTKAEEGAWPVVRKECEDLLRDKGFEPEYVALADSENLEPMDGFDTKKDSVALIAAWLGKIRLIDNMFVSGN
jgi:pantoate--beta-alanine ligase